MSKGTTQGTILYVEDDATPDTFLAVGNLTGFRTPSPDKPEVDITDLDSTGKEFMLGIPDFGTIELPGWYNNTSTGQLQMRADGISTDSTTRSFRIDLTSIDERWEFDGVVKGFVVEGSVDSAYTFNATIRTSGAPTVTTPIPSA